MAVVTKYFTMEKCWLFFRDLAAPGQDARLDAGSFRFLDLIVSDVKQRKARPGELVVGAELNCLLPGHDGLRVTSVLHQRHAKGMPAIKEARLHFNAPAVLLDGGVKVTDG